MASPSRQSVSTATLQASATVFDFACLFTHDLKRKQKRWQDGTLKYHTFNKRVMVYDDRGHFIGDAHWQAEAHLDTGDEFELDRGAAIVQVSECTGQREQDLTELIDKRARDVEKRRANAVSRTPRLTARPSASTVSHDQDLHFQLRQRPLSDMLGTPSRIGRAVISSHSPYEARQMVKKNEQSEEPRPAKRRKPEESPLSKSYHARALFGATLALAPFSQSTRPTQSQIRHNWANTELKTLLSSASPRQPPQSSPDGKPGHMDEQAEVVAEPASLRVSPPPRPRRAPKPVSQASETAGKIATKALEPGRRRPHLTQALGDDDHQPGILPENSSPLPTENSLPARNPVARSSPRRTSVFKKREERQDDVIVLEDEADERVVSGMRAPKEVKETPKAVIMGVSKENRAVKEAADVLPSGHATSKPRNEPRTELRIRSRQRRGLLLMSEKVDRGHRPIKPHTTNGVEAQPSSELDHFKQGNQMLNAKEPGRKPHQSLIRRAFSVEDKQNEAPVTSVAPTNNSIPENSASENGSHDAIHENVVDFIPQSPNSPSAKSPLPCEDIDTSDSDELPGKKRASRRLAERNTRPQKRNIADIFSEDESEDMETPPVLKDLHRSQATSLGPSVPRIAKMARKSIKSREIIGFVVPNDGPTFKFPPVAAPSDAAPRSGGQACSKNANDDEAESESYNKQNVQQSPPVQSMELPSVAQPGLKGNLDKKSTRPTPRLCNPATRGKKAAKKEDAAGQLPHTIVQLEPVAPMRIGAPKPLPSRNSSTLPGFVKANGGTWSVHAEDLLGMTRPVDKPSR